MVHILAIEEPLEQVCMEQNIAQCTLLTWQRPGAPCQICGNMETRPYLVENLGRLEVRLLHDEHKARLCELLIARSNDLCTSLTKVPQVVEVCIDFDA